MINQLFRSKFESNLTPFIVFLGLNAIVGFMLLMMSIDSQNEFLGPVSLTITSVWLLLFCVVAGCLSLLRYNRERSSRLYAQLPVTSLQIRLAHWFHASLYMCISSLMLMLVMFYSGWMPLLDILQFTLLYFSHAGVLLAAVTLFTGNTLLLIPEEIRKRTVVYFFLATLVTFLFLFAMTFIVLGYANALEGRIVNWPLTTLLMVSLCAALVALDIHLFRKRDNYLG